MGLRACQVSFRDFKGIEHTVEVPQRNAAAMLAVQYDELLAEKQIFRLQPRLPRESRAEHSQQLVKKSDRPRTTITGSSCSSPRSRFSGGTGSQRNAAQA